MNDVIQKDKTIENMIYEVRGKQVMLDSDLAKLYECKNGTKVINQAVNRNIERFPGDFYFQLTHQEYFDLKSQFVTSSSNNNYGGVRKLPYVFTEQGTAMLATVLKTPASAQVSVKIMRAFVSMRHYLNDNKDIYKNLNHINNKLIEHDEKLNYIFSKFDKKEKLYLNGQEYDAYSDIIDIFEKAKKELIIIDSYVDKTILDIIRNINTKVIIITKNNRLSRLDISKYNKQYNNLEVIITDKFHDRYFIIDKKDIYHSGTSINHAGSKIFSINKLEDKIIINTLIKSVKEIIKKRSNH